MSENLSKHDNSGSFVDRWHSESDYINRENMLKAISEIISNQSKNASEEWFQKIPRLSAKLEEALYANSQSLEAYLNPNTLNSRIRQTALKLGRQSSRSGSYHLPLQSYNQSSNHSDEIENNSRNAVNVNQAEATNNKDVYSLKPPILPNLNSQSSSGASWKPPLYPRPTNSQSQPAHTRISNSNSNTSRIYARIYIFIYIYADSRNPHYSYI